LVQARPDFEIDWSDGTRTNHATYSLSRARHSPWTFDDAHVHAVVTETGPGLYRLDVRPKPGSTITQVVFPSLPTERATTGRAYYGILGGTAVDATKPPDYPSFVYPGPGLQGSDFGAFAPLVITDDGTRGRIVAATNWPTKIARVRRDLSKTSVTYSAKIAAGSSDSFGALVRDVVGNATRGDPPWILALDHYRRWLATHYTPPAPPKWMMEGEGYFYLALQNVRDPVEPTVRSDWDAVAKSFGWMQIWGQTADTFNRSNWEWMGPALSARYASWLPTFAREKTATGAHVGYYINPKQNLRAPIFDAKYVGDWIARNRTDGANVSYLDTFGRNAYGDPNTMRELLKKWRDVADVLIEGYVDVYPAPSLMSGYVGGAGVWIGGPSVPRDTCSKCTFVALSRYLQGDHIGYFGVSDGEYVNAGPPSGPPAPPPPPNRPYWAERQAFLYGFKLEAKLLNDTIRTIVKLRKSVDWWHLGMRYKDVLGLTDIPRDIDIRRFDDAFDRRWLVVDNLFKRSGQTVRVRGKTVAIPSDALSIVLVDPGD
jgi:hypothetical protein